MGSGETHRPSCLFASSSLIQLLRERSLEKYVFECFVVPLDLQELFEVFHSDSPLHRHTHLLEQLLRKQQFVSVVKAVLKATLVMLLHNELLQSVADDTHNLLVVETIACVDALTQRADILVKGLP